MQPRWAHTALTAWSAPAVSGRPGWFWGRTRCAPRTTPVSAELGADRAGWMLGGVDVHVEPGWVGDDLVDERRGGGGDATACIPVRPGSGERHDDRPVDCGGPTVDVCGDGRQGDVRSVEPVANKAGILANADYRRSGRIRLTGALQIDRHDPSERRG